MFGGAVAHSWSAFCINAMHRHTANTINLHMKCFFYRWNSNNNTSFSLVIIRILSLPDASLASLCLMCYNYLIPCIVAIYTSTTKISLLAMLVIHLKHYIKQKMEKNRWWITLWRPSETPHHLHHLNYPSYIVFQHKYDTNILLVYGSNSLTC